MIMDVSVINVAKAGEILGAGNTTRMSSICTFFCKSEDFLDKLNDAFHRVNSL